MDDNGNTAGKGLHAVVPLALVVVDILLNKYYMVLTFPEETSWFFSSIVTQIIWLRNSQV